MIFTCNMNHEGEYDLEYSDIGLYQEESTAMDPVITDNAVSDGMNFNNAKSGIITVDHDPGELKLNAQQNDVTLSHHENEGEKKEERKNFALDVTKRGKIVTQNMVMFNRLELGEQNANQMNKKHTVVSLKSDSGEKIDDEYVVLTHENSAVILSVTYELVITDEERQAFMKEFSDRKRNDIGSDRTDDIKGEDEENFFVERVVKMRVNKKGKEEFLVKWVGYPLSEATWEPFENLSGEEACEYLVMLNSYNQTPCRHQ